MERTYNPWLIAIVASLAGFMEVLDTTITNVSLSHIAGTFGASQHESTWVLTSYLLSNGIVLPLSGWLSSVLGRKRFFMTCVAGFTLTSFACGIASSLPMLIIFRLLQGLSGGGLQPIQQAIIMDAFPPEKRGAAFGITGITMILAPVIGPTLGGFITDHFNWRWIFFMNIPVGIMAFWLINIMVQDPPHAQAQKGISIDGIGLGLVALGLGALQVLLDQGEEKDWFNSTLICSLAGVSGSCLLAAIYWLLKQKNPMIDLRLLRLPSFGLSCVMIFFMGFCLYSSSTLLPMLVQSQLGYDATLAGLVISPGGLAVLILMPFSGRLVNHVPARYLIAFGMGSLSLGLWISAQVTPTTDYNTLVFMRIVQVIGLPFLFIPISTLAFQDIPKEKTSKASALYALARNLGGGFGIAIVTTYLLRHQQIHQTYLSAHLSAAEPQYFLSLSHSIQKLIDYGTPMVSATQSALGQLYQSLLQQAYFLSYNDACQLMAQISGLLAIIAFCMPKNAPLSKEKAAITEGPSE